MKHGRARQHHARREQTPSAICLAQPKPPVTNPRPEPEVARALSLPQSDEPLVNPTPAPPQSRQSRRQERRAQAKIGRRAPPIVSLALITPPVSVPVGPIVAPVAPVTPPRMVPIDMTDAAVALPRSRALAKPRSRVLVILERLFRGPFRRSKPIEALPPVEQLRSLRETLATVQQTLDRLLDQAPA